MIKKAILTSIIACKALAVNACPVEEIKNYKFGTILDDVSVEFGSEIKYTYWQKRAKPGLRYKVSFDTEFSASVVLKVQTKLNSAFFNFFDFSEDRRNLSRENAGLVDDGDILVTLDNSLILNQAQTQFIKEEEDSGNVTYIYAARILVSELNLTEDQLVNIIIHEILHSIGIGHSLGGGQWWINNGEWVNYSYSPSQEVPIMHPSIVAERITEDDIHAFKLAVGINEGNTFKGVLLHEGLPVKGVNVIAINEKTGARYFSVVDRFGKGTGEFEIKNLPDGPYHFRFEPTVNFGFGGSGSRTGVWRETNFYKEPRFLTNKGFRKKKKQPFLLKNGEVLNLEVRN